MPNRIVICLLGISMVPLQALTQQVTPLQIGPLPISWISFSAQTNGNTVLLQWTTSQDGKVAAYTIDRSGDGQTWDSIGSEEIISESAGNQSVSFTDALPLNGTDYYRIKRISADDFVQYSAVAQVQFSQTRSYVVAPNPVVSNLNIWMLAGHGGALKVQLLSVDGRVIRELDTQTQSGQQNLQVGVDGISSGLYFVNIIDDQGSHPQKVLIL